MAMLDLRRTDLRGTTLENPYWVTSAELNYDADDAEAVLFSFPLTGGATPNKGYVLVTIICIEIITAFNGTSSITVGNGTIPTDAAVTGDTVTTTAAESFIPSASITEGTPAVYFAAAGTFVDAIAAGTFVTPVIIKAAATATPVIYAALTGTSPTTGAARVHALIHRLPLLG